jgi:hypothetical protein
MRLRLVELGRFESVRDRLVASYGRTREGVSTQDWVGLDDYVVMLESAHEVLGDEGMRQFGAMRIGHESELDNIGAILRSWKRMYGDSPATMLQVSAHLWRAALAEAGHLEVIEVGTSSVTVRFVDPPKQLRASRAWRLLLEGIFEGLVHAASAEGRARFDAGGSPDHLDAHVTWGANSPSA